MADRNDISSTESLLRIIREDKAETPSLGAEEGKDVSPVKRKRVRTKTWSSGKAMTVGIDLGYTHMRLVRVKNVSAKERRLLACEDIPFQADLPKDDPEFPRFLKKALTAFAGSPEKSEIWCLLSSARSEIRHLNIPKVPKKQIANAVYWTFKKETEFEEAAYILDFEILGNVFEQGVEKIAVTVYTALKDDVKGVQDLFHRIGFPSTGLSIGPFANQNIFRSGWISVPETTVASLYVGRGWSRIDIFSSGNLMLARGIKAGMNSMAECILERACRLEPLTIELDTKGAEVFPSAEEVSAPRVPEEDARKILSRLTPEPIPLVEGDPGYDLGGEEIVEMILPALERLARQAERSFEYYAHTIGPDRVQKLLVSGQYNIFNERVLAYMEEQTGVPCQVFDPLAPDIPFVNRVQTPASASERAALAPALGMALSDNSRTPNLLFTYRKKAELESISRINRTIFLTFLMLIALCTGVFLWQGGEIRKREATVAQLEQNLGKYSPRVNKDLLLQMGAKVTGKFRLLKEYGRRYMGMAAISEISDLTPDNIRLLRFKADLGPAVRDDKTAITKKIVLEGYVFGQPNQLADSLADYLMTLKGSLLFSDVSIQNTKGETLAEQEVLHFWVHLDLAGEGAGTAAPKGEGGGEKKAGAKPSVV